MSLVLCIYTFIVQFQMSLIRRTCICYSNLKIKLTLRVDLETYILKIKMGFLCWNSVREVKIGFRRTFSNNFLAAVLTNYSWDQYLKRCTSWSSMIVQNFKCIPTSKSNKSINSHSYKISAKLCLFSKQLNRLLTSKSIYVSYVRTAKENSNRGIFAKAPVKELQRCL
jgi:hypothetical protein